MLRAEPRRGIPTGIEEHEERADVMARGDGQELVDALAKSGGVLLPEQIVEKDAHGVHAHGFGPAEFFVDLRRDRMWLPATSPIR